MSYHLIALDLDETLLGNDFKISARNKKAIAAARAKGVKVVIASGRMFRSSLPYARELQLDTPLITYHGALIRNMEPEPGDDLYYHPVPYDYALAILKAAEEMGYHLNLYINDILYTREENRFSRLYKTIASIEMNYVGSLPDYLKKVQQDPIKLTIIDYEGELQRMSDYLHRHYQGKLNITKSHKYFLEITSIRASKGQALKELAGKLGISQAATMAIGDSYNDLDMIKYAGMGVAVANGREEILQAADHVTASNLADGVAEAIERFVL